MRKSWGKGWCSSVAWVIFSVIDFISKFGFHWTNANMFPLLMSDSVHTLLNTSTSRSECAVQHTCPSLDFTAGGMWASSSHLRHISCPQTNRNNGNNGSEACWALMYSASAFAAICTEAAASLTTKALPCVRMLCLLFPWHCPVLHETLWRLTLDPWKASTQCRQKLPLFIRLTC